jgi:hypothetical protein
LGQGRNDGETATQICGCEDIMDMRRCRNGGDGGSSQAVNIAVVYKWNEPPTIL